MPTTTSYLCPSCEVQRTRASNGPICRNCSYGSGCCCQCITCNSCSTQVNEVCEDGYCTNCCGCEGRGNTRNRQNYTGIFIDPNEHPTFHTGEKGRRFVSLEMEIAGSNRSSNQLITSVIRKWGGAIVHDGSLPSEGYEINTAPASGSKFVEQITEITKALKEAKAKVNSSCGMHCHVDARDMRYFDVRKLIKLYYLTEEALFSCLPQGRRDNHYAIKCGLDLYSAVCKSTNNKLGRHDLMNLLYGREENIKHSKQGKYVNSRYMALNLHSWYYRGSVEFRHHHGTTEKRKALGWGGVCEALLNYASSHTEKEIDTLPEQYPNPQTLLLDVAPVQSKWIKSRYRLYAKLNSGNDVEQGTVAPRTAVPVAPPELIYVEPSQAGI